MIRRFNIRRLAAPVLVAQCVILPAPVLAHFQMLYTPESALSRGQATQLLLLFTHPAHGGPNMEMSAPEAIYLITQRGDAAEPVTTDLRDFLEPIQWQSENGAVEAYRATLPNTLTRSLGDYVFVLEPGPYYEAQEDSYIQQFTKTVMNIGGVPGNWAEPVGLPAEIVPLDKPYANWTGGVFRGIVLADGEPVPYAELEVEYLNHAPDVETHHLAPEPEIEFPQDSFGTMSIRTNGSGEFTIGLPRAGWWGICALEVGADTEHEGKPLSQDAVLWVQVKDMQ